MNNGVEYLKLEKKTAVGGPLYQIFVEDFGTLLFVEVEPGDSKIPHYHKNITEYFFVISGQGKCFVDGKAYELEEGVRIKIPSKLMHTISNNGTENLKLIAFKDKPFSKENPDKHKECIKCNNEVEETETGKWVCKPCNKTYSYTKKDGEDNV